MFDSPERHGHVSRRSLLGGVVAHLVCRVVQRVPAGDHSIVLAAPVTGAHGDDSAAPLLYQAGTYGVLSKEIA